MTEKEKYMTKQGVRTKFLAPARDKLPEEGFPDYTWIFH